MAEKPPGFDKFDRLMRKLVQVPPEALMEQKANCCKLCGAPFTNINSMSFTNCNCARERPEELAAAQKKWDESRPPSPPNGPTK